MATLLAIVFAALVINVALAVDNTVYHIKPTLASPPHLQCKTLDVIARYPNLLFGYWKRNVSLIFLPGAHKLSEKITATDLYNLDLKLKVLSGRVDINCENGAYISLSGSGRVSFEGLHFSNCGGWDNGPYVPMRNPGVYIFLLELSRFQAVAFEAQKRIIHLSRNLVKHFFSTQLLQIRSKFILDLLTLTRSEKATSPSVTACFKKTIPVKEELCISKTC